MYRLVFLSLLVFTNVVVGLEFVKIHEKTTNSSSEFFRARTIANYDPFVYWGGPIIPNVKIIMVLWGSGVYAPYITQQNVPQSMTSYYTELVKSSWMDTLSEYNTNSQSVGRGTFVGRYTITPSVSSSTITDDFIEGELIRQINDENLPPNDDSTLYQIHFPQNKVISAFGMLSCVDFCAYHNTVTLPTPGLYYSIIPDFSSESDCSWGCGSSTEFNNVCSVSSHEIAEAITDPAIGFAYTYA